MNPSPPSGIQVCTPTETTIVFTRAFNAPRKVVWEAMFTPEKIRRWTLLPPGWTMTACEVEARVGGSFRLVSKTEDADPAMTLEGVFTEIIEHERAVHTEATVSGSGETIGTLVETHEFAESAGVTTMRITQAYPSKEERDGVIDSGMDQALEAGYERLDALLESWTVES